jgi:hypothetical protein
MEFPQLRAEVLTGVATGVQMADGELPFSRMFGSQTTIDVRGDDAKWDEVQPIRDLETVFEGREAPATTTDPGTVKPKAAGMFVSFKKRVIKPELLDQLRAVGGTDADVAAAERSLGFMIGDMMRRHYHEKVEYLIVSSLLDTQSITVGGATLTPDFGLAGAHDLTVSTSWATASTDIDADVETMKRLIAEDSGRAARTVLVGRNVPGYLRKNSAIKAWFQAREGAPADFDRFQGETIRGLFGLDWVTMRHGYVSSGTWTPFLADDTIIMIPAIDQGWYQRHRGQVQYPTTVYGGLDALAKSYGPTAWSRLKDNPPAAWYFQRWAELCIPVFPSAYVVADTTT